MINFIATRAIIYPVNDRSSAEQARQSARRVAERGRTLIASAAGSSYGKQTISVASKESEGKYESSGGSVRGVGGRRGGRG